MILAARGTADEQELIPTDSFKIAVPANDWLQ